MNINFLGDASVLAAACWIEVGDEAVSAKEMPVISYLTPHFTGLRLAIKRGGNSDYFHKTKTPTSHVVLFPIIPQRSPISHRGRARMRGISREVSRTYTDCEQ